MSASIPTETLVSSPDTPLSARSREKSRRLVEQGKVRRVKALVYEVEGEHGDYTVVLYGLTRVCTCPAKGHCSHVDAAERMVLQGMPA